MNTLFDTAVLASELLARSFDVSMSTFDPAKAQPPVGPGATTPLAYRLVTTLARLRADVVQPESPEL